MGLLRWDDPLTPGWVVVPGHEVSPHHPGVPLWWFLASLSAEVVHDLGDVLEGDFCKGARVDKPVREVGDPWQTQAAISKSLGLSQK